MKYLKIENDGLLDFRLVALMGGTTKSKDKFKIGQFGTGLKYTLSFLFRNNLDFKIFIGNEPVNIGIEKEEIASETFEIICINNQRTSITTKMGEDWTAWMIVRELWCNALDEGGAKWEVTDEIKSEPTKTVFYIQMDSQIAKVIEDWDKYFIHNLSPISETESYKLYPASDHLCVYKQGVLIYENDKQKGVFRYDISSADINEMREYRGCLPAEIARAMATANESAITLFLENVTDDHYEGNMDWEWYQTYNDNWKTVIGTGKVIYQKVLDDLLAKDVKMPEERLIVIPRNLYKSLTTKFLGIGAVYVAGKVGNFYEQFSEECENRIKQGLVILESCGYVFHAELVFKYGFFEDKTIQAQINLKEKTVYISKSMIQQPLFVVVAMLIEENEHFATGMSDETRSFQQHFINLYTRAMLAKHEIEI